MEYINDNVWVVFAVIASLLLVVEMFTTDFTAFVIAVGFSVGAIMALIGVPVVIALLLTFIASYSLYKFARPAIKAKVESKAPGLKVGYERLIGESGVMITPDKVELNSTGYEIWTASSSAALSPGDEVIVEKINGSSLIVKKVNQE